MTSATSQGRAVPVASDDRIKHWCGTCGMLDALVDLDINNLIGNTGAVIFPVNEEVCDDSNSHFDRLSHHREHSHQGSGDGTNCKLGKTNQ